MKTQGVSTLALVETVHAGEDPFFKAAAQLFSWIAIFAHFLIYLLTAICGMLLSPDFINLNTDGQSMGATLLKIWQISRNITNILLAFLLIIGAIMTVVFAEGGYVQKYAVKFVLAVVLVNFSWFFPRVVLDLANVLTATVYSLPSAIRTPCVPTDRNGNPIAGQKCKVIVDFAFFDNRKPPPWKCPIDFTSNTTPVCVLEAELDDQANTPNAIMGGLIYNHAKFQFFTQILGPLTPNPLAGPATLSRLPQLLTSILGMSLMVFFSLALLFPLLALALVLLIRIPIIWITVAFMPFMFIGVVAGDHLKAFNPMEIWNKFLHAAFIPVITAIPFSVGFIMINVAMANPPVDWNPLDHPFLRNMNLFPGIRNLWQLVWMGMSIAVVWIGARTAFKMDSLFEKISSPIMNAGASMGRLLMKLPLLAPLPIPGATGAWKDLNVGQALNIVKAPDQLIAPKFYVPSFGGGGGGAGAAAPGVAPDKAAEILDKRLRDDTGEKLNKINQTLEALNRAGNETERRKATSDLRIHLNNAMGGEGSVRNTGEMKQILDELRRKNTRNKAGQSVSAEKAGEKEKYLD